MKKPYNSYFLDILSDNVVSEFLTNSLIVYGVMVL